MLASSSQVTSSTAEIKSPDLNLILQRLEDIQHQDPAQSRPYEVMREYKVLRGSNTQPNSEVMAQINFAIRVTDDFSGRLRSLGFAWRYFRIGGCASHYPSQSRAKRTHFS